MHYLYILQSKIHKRHYIGISHDCKNRLLQHNAGDVRSTKAYIPWIMIYVESFPDKIFARKREIFLKRNARARNDLFEHFGAIV